MSSTVWRAGLASLLALDVASAQAPRVWRVQPEPVLRTSGSYPGSDGFVRVAGAMRLRGGELVVADGGALTVVVFDSTGRHIATRGGEGRGPGEFEDLMVVGRSADSIVLFDVRQLRMTSLDPLSGRHRLEPPPPAPEGTHGYPYARAADGSLLVLPISPTSMRHRDGVYRDSILVRFVDRSRTSYRDVGPVPWLTHLAVNPTNAERAMAVGSYPFGPSLFVAAVGDQYVIADSDKPSLSFYKADGTPAGIVDLGWKPRAFDEGAIRRAREAALDAVSNPRSRTTIEARYHPKYRPPREPYFSRIVGSRDGLLWVERFRVDPAAPAEYLVVSRSGPVATISLPAGLRLMEVGSDYLVASSTDADGTEFVSVYRYSR